MMTVSRSITKGRKEICKFEIQSSKVENSSWNVQFLSFPKQRECFPPLQWKCFVCCSLWRGCCMLNAFQLLWRITKTIWMDTTCLLGWNHVGMRIGKRWCSVSVHECCYGPLASSSSAQVKRVTCFVNDKIISR